MLVTWIPLFAYSAISVWDRPAVRGVVLFTLTANALAAAVIWRPSERFASFQALAFLSLLALGIPAAGGVSGITPTGMATAVVLVAWSTLFFGARGLWGMLGVLTVVLAHTAWQYLTARVAAAPPPNVLDPGYWTRNVFFLVSTFVLGGLIVRAAISAYDDTLAAERAARDALVREEAARRVAESESVVLQRRQATAALAAGLAHDVANVLQMTSLQAETILESATDPEHRAAAREILAGAQRGNAMVRELLSVGRPGPAGAEWFEAADVMDRLALSLRGILPPAVKATFERDASLRLRGDALRFEQVVINLVLNARDAMPAGGALTVSLRPAAAGEAALSVTDNGAGIQLELQQRIFDPFFTTKGPQDGSGLGLSMVNRIVTEAGGRIALTSEVGRGTTFVVTWPLADAIGYHASGNAAAAPMRQRQGSATEASTGR